VYFAPWEAYLRAFCTKRDGGGGSLLEGVLHQETSHGGGGGLLEGVLYQETSHGGGGGLLCTKRPAMVGLGLTLHQETSHGGGGVGCHFFKRMGGYKNKEECYHTFSNLEGLLKNQNEPLSPQMVLITLLAHGLY
jgi:hypothetical protein